MTTTTKKIVEEEMATAYVTDETMNNQENDDDDDDDHHHTNVYEEVRLSEMTYDKEEQLYQYQCPCGDLFEITLEDLWDGEEIALCPSCTLKLRVIYEESELPELDEEYFTESDVEEEEEEDVVVAVEKKTIQSPPPVVLVK